MRAVVIGGGVAGLVAARRLALLGADVVLLEAGERLGGRVVATTVGGIEVDGGAESFAVRGGAVAKLLGSLGLGGDVVEPRGSAWVALQDRTVPLPAGGVLGIPAVPFADDVRRVIDGRGAARAYLDRLRPVLKVGRYEMLGPLVRSRMGPRVLDRLVAPVTMNVYGAHPDVVPIEAIAPGLNAALTRAGSLSGGVLLLRAAAPPGAAAQGIAGGVHRMVSALEADLSRFGVEMRTGAAALDLEPAEGGGWVVETAAGPLPADRVIVTTDGAAALQLARGTRLAAFPLPPAAVSRVVLVRVDDRRLDPSPRGTGVLRAASCTAATASAITHLTAKWPWLQELAGPGTHVLRLSYRGDAAVPDATVVSDIAALMGVHGVGLVDRTDVVWTDPAPPLASETLRIRRELDGTALPEGLTVAGAWTAGTGLASVVASAERAVSPHVR